ncbi:MAG TPA: serine hydrolase domain-containing protein [Jiangellales bacterium]|nr:serine hydrolase domain-containing protein [Jiangellales bacterium]
MSDLQQQVQETIDDLVTSGAERGLQVAVYRHGEQIVDAVAGTDAAGRPLLASTPIHAMSTGKGVAATVVHVLVERGVFDYDTRIAQLWPEFAVHGKELVTVRHALTHTVGLPSLPEGTTAETLCDWAAMCAALAAGRPAWEPGTRTGYHAQTWGFIIGEVVRRATGRPISQVLRDEVAGPLGVADELYFGVPASEHARLARIEEAPGYAHLLAMFSSPVQPTADFLNRADVLAADMPFAGVMSARAVARMYAALLGPVDGVRLVSEQRLRELSAVAYTGVDAVIGFPQVWALGYGIGRPGIEAEPQTAFGMPGIGGSAAYADTATGTAFAITTTRLHPGVAPGLERVGVLVEKATA